MAARAQRLLRLRERTLLRIRRTAHARECTLTLVSVEDPWSRPASGAVTEAERAAGAALCQTLPQPPQTALTKNTVGGRFGGWTNRNCTRRRIG